MARSTCILYYNCLEGWSILAV